MKHLTYSTLIFLLYLFPNSLGAQYTFFTPPGAFAIEVSLPNSDLERLPIYRNAITSLAVHGDDIIGGTSAIAGSTPYIFTASLAQRRVIKTYDLEESIPGQQQIPTGFSEGRENLFFAGTIPNFDQDNSGHLIEIRRLDNGVLQIEKLSTPIEGEGILSLVINSEQTTLFGISYPSGYFFTYDIPTGKTETYDVITPTPSDLDTYENFALSPDTYLCRALVLDDSGLVYGSAPINRIFYFDPTTKDFEFLDQTIPDVWGRESMSSVESWTKDKNGLIYGGNSGDGILFQLNPKLKTVKNLGKPIMMHRIPGLTFGSDDKLYGIAGGAPGYSHLFSYDQDLGFKDLGNPEFEMKAPGIEQGILWRGFQLQSITSSKDGKYIVLGEKESLSQLLVFPVE